MNRPNHLISLSTFQTYDFVVIGGSLPGMVGALMIKKRHPEASIAIIDDAEMMGGNLLGHQVFGDHFDSGTHILQETGDEETDEIIETAVDQKDLVKLEGSVGDFVATIKNQKIWSATAVPDVLAQTPAIAKQVIKEIKTLRLEKDKSLVKTGFQDIDIRRLSAFNAALNRYGPTATNDVIMPILKGVFGDHHKLSGFALEFCNLMRLRLVDKDEWSQEIMPKGLHDRVAYPDQLELPVGLRHNKKSLYSSKNGARDFVLGLAQKCDLVGIHSFTSTRVKSINPHSKTLTFFTDSKSTTINCGQVLSCVGVSLTQSLITGNRPERRDSLPYRITHVLLNKPIDSQICYFYRQDSGSVIFRITNYAAFSGRNLDFRLTVETFGNEQLSDEDLCKAIEKELVETNIIKPGMVISSTCIKGKNYFPYPDSATFDMFSASSDYVKEFQGSGIITCGLGSENGAFFQNEILRHMVSQIRTKF